MFRRLICSAFMLAVCLLAEPRSFAHPMGNFSVNHYSKISLGREGIKISYIIDLAEIPTYQELQRGNVTADVANPAVKGVRPVLGKAQNVRFGLDARQLTPQPRNPGPDDHRGKPRRHSPVKAALE